IGNGVVIDPALFKAEIEALEASGHDLTHCLYLSSRAHLILPTHRLLDAAYEKQKGFGKIGTTGKGIGPAYTDKVGRNGLRIGDIDHRFDEKYREAVDRHRTLLRQMNCDDSIDDLESAWLEGIETIKRFRRIDSDHFINNALREGKKILAEGAQGTMLDIDFGSYPFVTSSNTICAGACTGLGVAPAKIGKVYGIFKAYCTRVGGGPFPTELTDETGIRMQTLGHEYGSVTGRPRRCGWIDLVALRYAIMIDGVTDLIMMKSDVLDTFDGIRACVAYEIDGQLTEDFPFDLNDSLKPVYVELPGWKTDMSNVRSEEAFPETFRGYLSFLEEKLGVPIRIVSVGPDRAQTILRDKN
ncbi:MAG: adenylosuccinate synthase, partial [Candidatus Accumulibacter sp.]|nr:adenylosuccinate synthase [Accumulibacter sp.]